MWLLFAIGSVVFAALTSILAKIGIENVNSNLATAIKTGCGYFSYGIGKDFLIQKLNGLIAV